MTNWAPKLRGQLSQRAKGFGATHGVTWYESLGASPTILFPADPTTTRHGNFIDSSYRAILANPLWAERLGKAHSQRRALPDDRQADARELDSCNSSDALLMNCFCYPAAAAQIFQRLLPTGQPEFGVDGKAKGFTLVFDVVRRFAQPLGIDLPKWEGRVIESKKGVVRLLPIAERAKQLFGEDGAQAVAARLEQGAVLGTNPLQGMLFPDLAAAPKGRGPGRGRGTLGGIEVSDESLAAAREATTLDRVHAAMLLQAGGRTNALRALLKAEQDRGPDFLRLANAFSALYPKGSEEKRLIDAMLLAVPR